MNISDKDKKVLVKSATGCLGCGANIGILILIILGILVILFLYNMIKSTYQ